jgi:type I restriction-modification system DNA methylase subunit
MANINERAELHKTIWKIANDLRGSVDGWEFKAYVLGSIFYRFISEVNAKLETLVIEGNELNAKIANIIKELGE